LFVNLKNVPPEGQALDRSMAPDSLRFCEEDFRVRRPVILQGRLEPGDEGSYRLRGRLDVGLDVVCGRCLESYPVDLREAIDLTYMPQTANVATSGEENRQPSGDEMDVSFYRNEELDLVHMVMEQIVLTLPMKPLCKPDCLGLCPVCGGNRNVTWCECSRQEIDPRWADLKNALSAREGE
jgi:uncharacterized protein